MEIKTLKNYVNGKWVASKNPATRDITNPVTGETIAHLPLTTKEEVNEMIEIARVMKLSLENFADEYVKATFGRLSLQERLRQGQYHCAMFDPFNNRCLVYDVRPNQCRTFPYWDQYKSNFVKLVELCPGVGVKE